MKIVSLVPSLTELVIDLGLDKELVGRTKFCIHPHQIVKSIPKVGGTKNVNFQACIQLNPDLILANKEENTREDIEALQQSVNVHITEISNYNEALQAIQDIGQLTDRKKEAQDLAEKIEMRFSTLSGISSKKKKVCYLIWNNPMMTIGNDTFIHNMLDKCGFENIFGDQNRYPNICAEDVKAKKPDFIFLSSEPFPFTDKHVDLYEKLFPNSKVVLVDGEFFSWYGSRMVLAADYFKSLISQIY